MEIKPTESELEILQVIWKKGQCTVRDVHEELAKNKDAGYTTTLKLMQIMHDKGMLARDESSMTHIYSTTLEEQAIKQNELKKFVDTMYNGSAKKLMMELLGHAKTTKKEWQTIQELLNKMEDDK